MHKHIALTKSIVGKKRFYDSFILLILSIGIDGNWFG